MTLLTKITALTCAALLCACASTNSSSPAVSLFNNPKSTFTPGSRDDQLAVDNEVKALNPYAGYQKALLAAGKYYKEDHKDPDGSESNKLNQNLLREGMSMIEYRCGVYFDELGKAIQSLSFQRKETSLIGGLVQGSMGLANQSSKAIANTGAIFGFATSSMDAYQEAFLYTPDIDYIRRLILNALQNNAAQISETINDNPLTYGGAISYLKQYESNCQPASIRALVNQAVSQAVEEKTDGQVTVALAGLATVVGAKQGLNQDQAFGLYWLQSDKYQASSDAKTVSNLLKGINSVFNGDQPDPAKAKEAKHSFLFFPRALLKAWDARIDELHAPKVTPTAAATAPGSTPPVNTNIAPVPNYGATNWATYGTVAPTYNLKKK